MESEELFPNNPRRVSSEQLQDFTSNFSEMVGSGGYGDVYKGILPNKVQVAVKVLKLPLLSDGVSDQIKAGVGILGNIHHINVVKLWGFCFEEKMKAIVYEFMEKESLYKLLCGDQSIAWETLSKIATGTAKGLSYLHEDCYPEIIHYEIKPSNILLDSNFIPRVSDFGLAKFIDPDKTHITESGGRGTRVYVAPEFNTTSEITSKCDVYSYGITLFDIICGKKHLLKESRYLFPSQVWKKFNEGCQEEVMEEFCVQEENREQAKRILLIALQCVQFWPADRPSMSDVVRRLEGAEEVKLPNDPRLPGSSSGIQVESSTSKGMHSSLKPVATIVESVSTHKQCQSFSNASSSDKDISLEKGVRIRAKELTIENNVPEKWEWTTDAQSRFPEVAKLLRVHWLEIKGTIHTHCLSPETTYVVYFVFKFAAKMHGFDLPAEVTVKFAGEEDSTSETRKVYLDPRGNRRSRIRYSHHLLGRICRASDRIIRLMSLSVAQILHRDQYPRERGDGWMEVEMGKFDNDYGEDTEVEMTLFKSNEKTELDTEKSGLIVECIELRPKVVGRWWCLLLMCCVSFLFCCTCFSLFFLRGKIFRPSGIQFQDL